MGLFDSIVNDVTGAASGLLNDVEGAAGSLLGGSTGGVVGSLLGDALGGPLGGMLGSELPQLLGSLLGGCNQSQNQNQCIQPFPFPFSSAGLNNYLQNPSQLFNTIGNINTQAPGVGSNDSLGGFLNNFDTASVDSQVTDLMSQATTAAQKGDATTAEKDMIQAQTIMQSVSQLLNQIGEMQKEAIQNSKLQ